ncbi:MAG: hypothetical protein HQL66_07655, partial [Magnetococcales bacterium]|nr:hypothetical protein [Magnetococcales bacterium]
MRSPHPHPDSSSPDVSDPFSPSLLATGRDGHLLRVLALAVFVAAIVPFFEVGTFDFVVIDDAPYIYDNPFVREGITWRGVHWALTSTHFGWLPLTRLSLMLDVTLFGLNAGAMHLVNVFFHACNALLVFLLLHRATALPWPAAGVAVLFAVHPLRVESVAWISERKDVLFAFFVLLALHAYQEARWRSGWRPLLPVLLLFIAAGMAKPMAVMLPVMLLLWDFWPLGRLPTDWRRLLLEKIPFFVVALLLAGITVW